MLIVAQPNLLSRNLGAFLDITAKFEQLGVSVEYMPPSEEGEPELFETLTNKDTHVVKAVMGANGQS